MTAEAEAGDALEEEGGAGEKKKSKKMLFIIAGAVVALLGGGAAVFMMLGSPPPQEELAATPQVPETFTFNLPTMTVNLNTDGGRESFLKITVALEVANEEMMTQIQPRMAKVVDAFQVYLRELRPADLEGSAGIYRLKEELRRRVNIAIFPSQVESILFKEILVQ